MNGLLLVEKPGGCTSHDVVKEIRKALKIREVGHFGTLDPLATGLLVIACGKATRLFPFFSREDKVYQGRIRLGFSTDTYDAEGVPVSPETIQFPDKGKLQEAILEFTGEQHQLPPPYSAKKYKGKPLYKLAREKREFQLRPQKILIHSFSVKKYEPPYLDFEVKCSAGTYIRSLAHDLGQKLGCGAHLSALTRTEAGSFHLRDCRSLDEIRELARQGKLDEFLLPLESLLDHFPKTVLNEPGASLARNGGLIRRDNILKIFKAGPADSVFKKEAVFRLFDIEGRLIGFARKSREEDVLHPFLIID